MMLLNRNWLNLSTPCILPRLALGKISKMSGCTFFLCVAPACYPAVGVNYVCIFFGRQAYCFLVVWKLILKLEFGSMKLQALAMRRHPFPQNSTSVLFVRSVIQDFSPAE